MQRPSVGVGVLVFNDKGQILLGKRKGSSGVGMWQNPGGHLEFGETPEQTAIRELAEETGLKAVGKIYQGPWLNTFLKDEQLHYISIFMHVYEFEGTLENLEPDKCEGWRWFETNALPEPLFYPLALLLQNHNIDYVQTCSNY